MSEILNQRLIFITDKDVPSVIGNTSKGGHVTQNFTIGREERRPDIIKKCDKPKIIKKYGNRKLYDTEQSSYVVLSDLARMVRNNEEFRVIDNETKIDITSSTLTQIILVAEKKVDGKIPLDILKNIIMTGNGTISNFLAEKGFFAPSEVQKEAVQESAHNPSQTQTKSPTLEERIANAASSSNHEIEESELPELPISNKNL